MAVYTRCLSVFVGENIHGVEVMYGKNMKKNDIQLCFIYCPPQKALVHVLKKVFCALQSSIDFTRSLVVMGDFNIDCQNTATLSNFLNAEYALRQVISSYTTDRMSTIDHVYTNIDETK